MTATPPAGNDFDYESREAFAEALVVAVDAMTGSAVLVAWFLDGTMYVKTDDLNVYEVDVVTRPIDDDAAITLFRKRPRRGGPLFVGEGED